MHDGKWRVNVLKTFKIIGITLMVAFVSCAIMIINVDNINAETEDPAYKVYTPKEIYEPFWEWRFGTQSTGTTTGGTGVICQSKRDANCHDYELMLHKSASLNVYQEVTWNGGTTINQDYGTATFVSHKMYINSLTTTGYTISLSSKYYCIYWQTGSTVILNSYYQIIGYNSNDVIVSTGSPCYIARYDTVNGYYTSPTTDSLVQGGTATYTISSGSSVSYFKIKFTTEGNKLISTGDYEGIELLWTETVVKYYLFSGSETTRGNSYVNSAISYPTDGYVTLELRYGANDGPLDYGTVRAWTPLLNINNNYSTTKNIVGDFKIDYTTSYWWNSDGNFIYKGFFTVYYYNSDRTYLGSDIKQWIDWDNTVSPSKTISPESSGTITIPYPSTYDAKYIKVEVKLTGSYQYCSDGALITFSNLKITGGRQFNTEVLWYGESHYEDANKIPNTHYYDIRYQLLNNADSHLYTFYADFDDAVDQNDFTGTNSDDVRSNDFVIFSGHGGQGFSDTYLHLTGGSDVDDDGISNFGPETDIVFFIACEILGNNDLGIQQRSEWANNGGLYYNHGILGFYNSVHGGDPDHFHNFILKLRSGCTFAEALEIAYYDEPWCSIWDTESQKNNDKLWDSLPNEYGFQNDETTNDDTYWTHAAWE